MNKHNLRLYLSAAPRRNKIKLLRAKGWAWTEIAKKYAITPQRAQQIGKQ